MTKPSLKNVAASVHDRLLNKARETRRPFNELLQYFAMERLLYRLSQSPHVSQFVLKGALMLNVWGEAALARPTKDIDFLGEKIPNTVQNIVALVKEICRVEVEPDGILFDPESVEGVRIKENADYEGVRVQFRGTLGTARIAMQLDIAFGDVIVPEVQSLQYPSILDFPPPQLSGYSKESTVAEKFEAMVKLGEITSRTKDFFDIWVMSRQFDSDGPTLARAVQATFSTRKTKLPASPQALTAEFARDPLRLRQWGAFLRRSRLTNTSEDFDRIVREIGVFLLPVVKAITLGRPFEGMWRAPNGWVK